MKAGRAPTLEEVAEEALVSRATAYRYFTGVEPLLAEASVDLVFAYGEALLAGEDSDDPVERLERAEAAVARMIKANGSALRAMLAFSLQRERGGAEAPLRQNRHTPLIEAALAPARDRFAPKPIPCWSMRSPW